MSGELSGKKVAILAANGFEQVELTEPKLASEEAGATASIVSPESGKVKGWKLTNWGDEFPVDVPLEEAKADDFDALVLPGGVMNPDKLRTHQWALHSFGRFSRLEIRSRRLPRPLDADRRRPGRRANDDLVRVDPD